MPEEIPVGAPDHPYYAPEKFKEYRYNKTYAQHFWWYAQDPEADGKFDNPRYTLFPAPPTKMKLAELTSEKVIEEFDTYKSGLLKLRQDEEWAKLPNGGKKLDEFNLYDVYLYGLWDTHRSAYDGQPANERSTYSIAETSKKEQALQLVKEAMDTAGQSPPNTWQPPYPR